MMPNENALDQPDFSRRNEGVWLNRGSLEIIDLVLMACKHKALKTHIMYRCNLNSKQVQTYLNFLLRFRLVEKKRDPDTGRYFYETTARGRKFMLAYTDLLKILTPDSVAEG